LISPTSMSAEAAAELLLSLHPSVPYRWTQTLALELRAESEPRAFARVVRALTQRVKTRGALALQLEQLKAGDTTLPDSFSQEPVPPSALKCALRDWQQVNSIEELPSEVRQAAANSWGAETRGRSYFTATACRAEVILVLAVLIRAEYPRVRPSVLLRWRNRPPRVLAMPSVLAELAHPAALAVASKRSAEAFDMQLAHLEQEVNQACAFAGRVDNDYVLLEATNRLRRLLDVYIETDGGSGATAVCGSLCSRRVRGRDRRKPFIFVASQFDQSR